MYLFALLILYNLVKSILHNYILLRKYACKNFQKKNSVKKNSSVVYLFTGATHINTHGCKCARIGQRGYFSSVDPWQNVKK